MPFQVSPGLTIVERDNSITTTGVSTSIGAMVGTFAWGPAESIQTVDSEATLLTQFHRPNDEVAIDWFSAADFLAYTNNLQLVRAVSNTSLNSTVEFSGGIPVSGTIGIQVKNIDDNDMKLSAYVAGNVVFAARYPGVLGNSLQIAWCDTAGFNEIDSNDANVWPYAYLFSTAPDAGNYHIVVIDQDGLFSNNVPGTILETYTNVSKVSTAKRYDGSSNYVQTMFRNLSNFVWMGNVAQLSGSNSGISFGAGSNGGTVTDGERQAAYDLFKNTDEVDISLIYQAGGSVSVGKHMIDNVANVRRDLVAFVSPQMEDVVGVANATTRINNTLATRTVYGSSNYAFMDSVWKQRYDQYNDVYRWLPLNADMAGLCARTDYTNDPWWSPAGESRGQIKNCIKLSHALSQAERDTLYKNGVNPVITVRGVGTILYGDKTLESKQSAFDRINVRRLFNTIEKAIGRASRAFLFEFNDEFTRSQFINVVEPYLREVKGRQGVTDFYVKCDESNNTAQVIDANEFVADIYIKANRSINFIQLTFVSTRSGITLSENM